MTRKLSYAAAMAAAFACARAAHAQETVEAPAALAPGKHAFSFDLPQSGGGAIAGWANLTARTQLGLRLSAAVQRERVTLADSSAINSAFRDVHLGMELRRFVPRTATIAPFLSGSVGAGVGRQRISNGQATTRRSYWDAGVGIGGGVEWFPVSSVSVGGRVGVDALYRRTLDRDDVNGGHKSVGQGFLLDTGTSSLALKIYF